MQVQVKMQHGRVLKKVNATTFVAGDDEEANLLEDYRGVHIFGDNGQELHGFHLHDLKVHDVAGHVYWIGNLSSTFENNGTKYQAGVWKETG